MEGDFIHITNRGVEKRKVFLSEEDYLRFVHNISDFNSTANAQSYFRRRGGHNNLTDLRGPSVSDELVDVFCWALLPNHPHIFVSEKIDGGASVYSMKQFSGYTKYFNEKNKRSGVLFQGKSKIILVNDEDHLEYIPFYIHSNPLDLFQPKWREVGLKDIKKAIEFLENYRWSSYPDIIGKKNFPDTINKKLFYEVFSTNEKRHRRDMKEWLAGAHSYTNDMN